ncbi:MAG TPA: hypothetical protein EYG28_00945 [Nitrospiria bacterium]|nr:hypothetical protein [Candidatus Manganitrophaceae bacterium]HIL33963.1 hypothetical protein [Candidatus Manganitrophaceae bacterium]
MREHPTEYFFRDTRMKRIFEGTREIQGMVIRKMP